MGFYPLELFNSVEINFPLLARRPTLRKNIIKMFPEQDHQGNSLDRFRRTRNVRLAPTFHSHPFKIPQELELTLLQIWLRHRRESSRTQISIGKAEINKMPKYSGLAGHQFGAFDGHYPHFCHLLRLLRVVRSSERKQANEIEPKIGNQGGSTIFFRLMRFYCSGKKLRQLSEPNVSEGLKYWAWLARPDLAPAASKLQ